MPATITQQLSALSLLPVHLWFHVSENQGEKNNLHQFFTQVQIYTVFLLLCSFNSFKRSCSSAHTPSNSHVSHKAIAPFLQRF